MSESYQGSCLCGAIRYQADEIMDQMGHCHCSMCRKFHGAAMATLAETPADKFHWLSGESLLQSFTADNGTVRQFCKNCGSSLTFAASNDDGSVVEFSLGTLDSEIPKRPDCHIYLDSKADWYQPGDDGLPRHRAGRDSEYC